MADHYPPRVVAVPLTDVRRQRVLPVQGEVLVNIGDQVEPAQVVAHTNLPGDLHILPAARQLGVSGSQLKRCLRVNPGDPVQPGEVVATRRGIFGRSVKSPVDGIVVAVGGGRVLIETRPSLFELHAYIYGMVINVLEGWGAAVETTGALVEGAWGAGGEAFGVLRCVTRNPGEPLRPGDIDPSNHGMILVGGSGFDRETLGKAVEFQVRGIITGGIPSELVALAERSPIPIVVTEGIGEVPMSEPVFELLTTHDGREASVSGRFISRWGVVRPEVVIALPADMVPPPMEQGPLLQVGSRVRLVRAPYAGRMGTVTALPSYARPVETGARASVAEVDLGGETPVVVPLANLEVLGEYSI